MKTGSENKNSSLGVHSVGLSLIGSIQHLDWQEREAWGGEEQKRTWVPFGPARSQHVAQGRRHLLRQSITAMSSFNYTESLSGKPDEQISFAIPPLSICMAGPIEQTPKHHSMHLRAWIQRHGPAAVQSGGEFHRPELNPPNRTLALVSNYINKLLSYKVRELHICLVQRRVQPRRRINPAAVFRQPSPSSWGSNAC